MTPTFETEIAVALSQAIRIADGGHRLGAGELADRLAPRIAAAIEAAYEAGNGYPAGAPEIELAVAVRALGARGSEKPQ